MVNPVLPSNTVAAGQSGHVADHNKITDAIQTVADAVTALEGNGSITTARLADSAVTSAKIADGTIATGDLADGAVTSAKIADGTIATGDLADSAVTSAKIADGTIVNADVNASAAIDVSKLSGVVSSATVGNLLTTAQASCESDVSVWTAAYLTASNATVVYDTASALWGSGSHLVTANGTNAPDLRLANSPRPAVTAGRTYTASVGVQNVTGSRTVLVRVLTYAANGTLVDVFSSTVNVPSNSSWQRVSVTFRPTGAAVSAVVCVVASTGSVGDQYRIDTVGLWEGAGGQWAMPGTVITGLGSYWDETVGRRRFDWDTVNNRWQLTYSDTGWREILTFDNTGTITQGAFDAGGYWGPRSGQAGYIRVRRRAGMQHFWIRNVASVNAAYLVRPVMALPAGFRFTDNSDKTPLLALPATGNAVYKATFLTGETAISSLAIQQTGTVDDYIPAQQVAVINDTAWPTTLPGTAVGTIPNA